MAKRTYDIRIRNAVAISQNPDLFPELNIPRSTAREWIRDGAKNVVSIPQFDISKENLIADYTHVKNELHKEQTINRLRRMTQSLSGMTYKYARVASSELKSKLLEAIEMTRHVIPLKDAVETVGLSMSRYISWTRRKIQCRLADRPSCPKLSPTKITHREESVIRNLLSASEYFHFGINSLAQFARRNALVFASTTAWYRIMKQFNLRRSGVRLFPNKPRIGARAARPNQMWHIDQTVLRVADGSRVFIRAIIDNYSRYILSWQVTDNYGGTQSKELIQSAWQQLTASSRDPEPPHLLMDSGTENLNKDVDRILKSTGITRTIAQIDVEFSNSMIERFFRSIKHRWLYFRSLPNIECLRLATEKFIYEYSNIIPHSALGGATPFEVFTGQWTKTEQIALEHLCEVARENRRQENLNSSCGFCPI